MRKIKKINEMKLSFLSRSSNESFARATVAAFAAQLDPTIGDITDIKTAVSEAVTNSVVHAYGDEMGQVHIRASIFENGLIEIIVRDTGKGIEDIEKAREPMFTTCDTGERSGMGFTIMETFMDYVKVNSRLGKGTRVRMGKKIGRRV